MVIKDIETIHKDGWLVNESDGHVKTQVNTEYDDWSLKNKSGNLKGVKDSKYSIGQQFLKSSH